MRHSTAAVIRHRILLALACWTAASTKAQADHWQNRMNALCKAL